MLRLAIFAIVVFGASILTGCGEKDGAPITEFTDEHKKQQQELMQQRTDEWGNKAR
jgi:hypothetical protein